MTVRKAHRGLIFPIVSAITAYNVTSISITAPAKRGFFLGTTSVDNSTTVPCVPTLTGWVFQMVNQDRDSGASQNLALWLGVPMTNQLLDASGTTITLTNAVVNSTFTGAIFRQYDGSFRGEILDILTTNTTAATSVTCVSPSNAMRAGKAIGIVMACMASGGAGVDTGTDTAMPDVGAGGLTEMRMTADVLSAMPASTVISSSRSARWSSQFIVMR